jgi:hypothetical protein
MDNESSCNENYDEVSFKNKCIEDEDYDDKSSESNEELFQTWVELTSTVTNEDYLKDFEKNGKMINNGPNGVCFTKNLFDYDQYRQEVIYNLYSNLRHIKKTINSLLKERIKQLKRTNK